MASSLRGPLAAYLGVRQANEASDLNTLQQAGAVQGLLAKMQAQQKQAQFEREIAQAQTPEQQAQISLKFGGPDAVIKHLDRQAQIRATEEAAKGRVDLQRQLGLDRLTHQENTVKMMHQFRMGSLRNAAERNAELARHNKEMEALADERNRIMGDRAALPKPLPAKLQTDLVEAGKTMDASERFLQTFKDDYGGFISDLAGRTTLAAEKRFSENTGRVSWWQDYEMHQNVIRNKLFGSALTQNEQAIWERSAVTPGMKAEQIRANLKIRENIERTGFNRLVRSSAAQYSPKVIEEAIGRPIPEGEKIPTFSSESEAAAANLKPGTKVIINGVRGTWQ